MRVCSLYVMYIVCVSPSSVLFLGGYGRQDQQLCCAAMKRATVFRMGASLAHWLLQCRCGDVRSLIPIQISCLSSSSKERDRNCSSFRSRNTHCMEMSEAKPSCLEVELTDYNMRDNCENRGRREGKNADYVRNGMRWHSSQGTAWLYSTLTQRMDA